MSQGWLKIYRELKDKAIWKKSTPGQKSVLITILMMANHQAKSWEWNGKKFTVQQGQFISSPSSIAKEAGLGITRQIVRGSLARFANLGFLTTQSTNDSTLVTIVNWELYQGIETNSTNQSTNRQPTDNQPTTTNKNVRMKEGKNKDKEHSQQSRKREYADGSPEMIEAVYLWEKIKGNNPEHRKPNLQSWADDIRKMHELDHRSFEKIHKMIDWCQLNPFWQANILSAAKLRSKFDMMAAQANRNYSANRLNPNRPRKENWGYGED